MSFFEKLLHDSFSQEELGSLGAVCASAALLAGVAIFLSGADLKAIIHSPSSTAASVFSLFDSGANTAAAATYNTPSTYQWTAPAYVTDVWVTVVGAGGGGGGFRWSDGCSGDADTGGGGGSGGSILSQHIAVTPGNEYTVVVGAGGTGGAYVCGAGQPPNGTAGGNSSFGGTVVATGGSSNSIWAGGAGGTPGGGKGADGALYEARANPGGTNGSGYGSGGTSSGPGQKGGNGYVAIYLTPPPALTITGNGQTGSTTVAVGQAVIVSAAFIPAAGDTLLKTAINDYQNNLWCGTGNVCNSSMWTAPPLESKTYTFTPTAPGEYIFYPAAQTEQYTSWNNYSKSLLVRVHPACPAGQHWVPGPSGNYAGITFRGQCVPDQATCPGVHEVNPPACTCETGYVRQNGACVLPTSQCAGVHEVNYPACSCDIGYHKQNGVCVPDTCSDPRAVPPLCSSCISGYETKNGICTPIPPSTSLSAYPLRVQKGTGSTVSWNVTGLSSGSGTACSITSNPAGVFYQSMPANTAPSWSGTAPTGAINGATIITLSCTGAVSKSVTVGIVPVFQEI